jgi:MFS family permease
VIPTNPRALLPAVMGPSGVGFRRFWLATSVSVLGTWMAAIALSIRMYDVTGSPGWVSALLFAEFVPSVLIGLLAGNRLNRLRLRRAMVLCDLGSAVVFALLALISTPWAVVALAGTVGLAVGIFRPLATAAVPMLVSDDDLESATGAIASADNSMTFLGAVLGGVLVGSVGAEVALALNAVSFVLSAGLIASCVALASAGTEAAPPAEGRHTGAAIRRIAGSPVLRQIAVGWTVTTLVLGAVNAVQVPLLRGTYDASAAAVGVLLGLTSLGLVAGSLFAGARRFGRAAYPLSLAGIGASAMITGAAPHIALVGLGLLLLGVFNGVAVILNRTRVVRDTDPAERAGLVSFLISLSITGQGIGTIAGGVVASAASPRWAFVAFGLVALTIAAPVALSIGPRAEWVLQPSPWVDGDDAGR